MIRSVFVDPKKGMIPVDFTVILLGRQNSTTQVAFGRAQYLYSQRCWLEEWPLMLRVTMLWSVLVKRAENGRWHCTCSSYVSRSYNPIWSATMQWLAHARRAGSGNRQIDLKITIDPHGEFIIWQLFHGPMRSKTRGFVQPSALTNLTTWGLENLQQHSRGKASAQSRDLQCCHQFAGKSSCFVATGSAFFPAIESQQLVPRRHQSQRHHQLLWSCRGVAASLEFAPQHGG